jgi:hypothetical protein
MMTGSEAIQSVQFVTVKGERFAVLNAEDWLALLDWVESLEDVQVARAAMAELAAAGGDRIKAGWSEWEAVARELS